jgi:hypothetical protein
MRKPLMILMTVALLVSSCSTGGESGGAGSDVVIEAVILAPDGASGTFVASGSAVDSGVVCASGEWTNVDFSFGGNSNWFEDEMICADGSGSFVVRVSDLGIPTVEEPWTGPWVIVRGSGRYGALQGNGDYSGDFSVEPGTETYTGTVSPG